MCLENDWYKLLFDARLLRERDELNDQVSGLQIEMGLKTSPLEGKVKYMIVSWWFLPLTVWLWLSIYLMAITPFSFVCFLSNCKKTKGDKDKLLHCRSICTVLWIKAA